MNIAVIFAGGSGTRMNSKSKPKQFLEMNGKPIIIHTIEYFEQSEKIDAIVVSCIAGWIDYLKELLHRYHITKVNSIVKGGTTGQESIYNGLREAKKISDEDNTVVVIHDGVRPLITEDLITRNIETVKKFGSAVTVTPVTETIVVSEEKGKIKNVVKRDNCYHAKAPQSFYLKDILNAHEKAREEGFYNMIDSATLMQYYGYSLHVVEGTTENIKITNPADFYIFRALYEARENSQIFGL
jgi:2-C-methyl-D-erythritol 4-phosphate cytidylyltransferase